MDYIYCETEFSYDKLMLYGGNPQYMLTDNNYTKYLRDNLRGIVSLKILNINSFAVIFSALFCIARQGGAPDVTLF